MRLTRVCFLALGSKWVQTMLMMESSSRFRFYSFPRLPRKFEKGVKSFFDSRRFQLVRKNASTISHRLQVVTDLIRCELKEDKLIYLKLPFQKYSGIIHCMTFCRFGSFRQNFNRFVEVGKSFQEQKKIQWLLWNYLVNYPFIFVNGLYNNDNFHVFDEYFSG